MLLVCTNGLKSLKADDFPRCLYTLAVLILEFHSGKELELSRTHCAKQSVHAV